MKISTALIASVFAAAMVLGSTASYAASGKVESVENGGRVVVIAGTKYKVSGSRTKVMVGGNEASRDDIKVGMECTAEGDGTAKMISCK